MLSPKNKSLDHTKHLDRIRRIFPDPILSWTYHDDGFDNHAYEINNTWIFKIPKRDEVWDMLIREKAFLDVFHAVSPLPVPHFQYIGERIVGYQKVHGEKLTGDRIKSLKLSKKSQLATELGTFLHSLHTLDYPIDHRSPYRDFFTKQGFYRHISKIQDIVYPRLPHEIRSNIETFLNMLSNHEENFKHNLAVVHTDLYYSHLLWDEKTKRMSGVIDFGEISYNAVTMDFTLLADFCDPDNDIFLREILHAYKPVDIDLYRKIKVFAYVEKLYWPLEDIEDSIVDPSKLEDLEHSLAEVVTTFTRVPEVSV